MYLKFRIQIFQQKIKGRKMYPRSQPNQIIYTRQPQNCLRITYSSPYTPAPTKIQQNKQSSTQSSFHEPFMPNCTNAACNRVSESQNKQESLVNQNINREMDDERMTGSEKNEKELKQQSCFQVHMWRILLIFAIIGAVLLAAKLLGSKSLYEKQKDVQHHRMRQFSLDHIKEQYHNN